MPQMAPLNWTSLYIMFSFMFVAMIIMHFYVFMYTPKTSIKFHKTPVPSWKW
uniref:ATP synthase F0 subunit 8 n=1 Tax=Alcidodes juglans TaxID=2530216 RepID=A0A482DS57_9CUCU|nr:ATP synthase F0 subunit 8 [Alcidodes juglans]QBM10381.1 ATP synthase F0 subunit 8 [Alcidodes juglans]